MPFFPPLNLTYQTIMWTEQLESFELNLFSYFVGIDKKTLDSSLHRNNEFGSDQKGTGCRRSMLKEGEQTEDVDCLDLSNLFSSNNCKINSKKAGEILDLHSPEGVEVSSGASKDTAEVEEVLSAMYLSNLFSSNKSKINSNRTGETLNLCSPGDIEVSSGLSKDTEDVEDFSIRTPEKGVQCSDVCSLTASAGECVRSTPGG